MKWFKAWLIKLIDERIQENDFVLESRRKAIDALDAALDSDRKTRTIIKTMKQIEQDTRHVRTNK